MEHGLEHGNTWEMTQGGVMRIVDTVTETGVTVADCAPGGGAPECGSISETSHLIRPANETRRRPGRVWPKPASVALLAPGGEGPRWYVAAVDAGEAWRAWGRVRGIGWAEALEHVLGRMGFAAVVPQYLDAGGVLRAAFPGYAMVEFDKRDPAWRQVPHVRGVRRLIGPDAERPVPVAAVQAAWVLGQFAAGGKQRQPVERVALVPLRIGMAARVVDGLGLGWSGTVVASDGRTVALDVAGRVVRVAQAAVEVCGDEAAGDAADAQAGAVVAGCARRGGAAEGR